MRLLKLKKQHYKNLELLLQDAGLVVGNQAYPSNLHISLVTQKKINKEIKAAFKKQYPGISKRKLDSVTGMHFLNLGPSTILQEAIKPGYAIIEELEENDIK